MKCRICEKETEQILDLGYQPLANGLLDRQDSQESRYPLRFYFCHDCQYGMTDNLLSANIFDETYPYYSSINTSYVKQCRDWAIDYRAKHNPKSVLEIGCNDGYMLQNFKGITCFGFEPSYGPYKKCLEKDINVINQFFSKSVDCGKFDLIIANNVLAHTPFLKKMAKDISDSLNQNGMAVIEFPTLESLIDNCQYDTIYHEHFSYFSLYSLVTLFSEYGLFIQDFENIPSHGGSIRAYFSKAQPAQWAGMARYSQDDFKIKSFGSKVRLDKTVSISQIIYNKGHGKKLALFGAAAKGNTWLNYLGMSYDFFEFCVDETPYKQGKFLPGSRIPIVGIEELSIKKPDILYILPWNFKDEIIEKTKFISHWGGEHKWR